MAPLFCQERPRIVFTSFPPKVEHSTICRKSRQIHDNAIVSPILCTPKILWYEFVSSTFL
jgi:hypothetical protein